ncbi:hypothetical protein T07_10977 [Trichinella nelsoni]|uniref:Uncharacterized protein n=1 Tax=Trichinella nelsoni TaxID=6336 RepID=A0A0V0SIF0_9BILA|nr:hypothetical protein T07_10977 [Trichinella nelsoni]
MPSWAGTSPVPAEKQGYMLLAKLHNVTHESTLLNKATEKYTPQDIYQLKLKTANKINMINA